MIYQDSPNVTDVSLLLLNGLAQGDDYYNRIGREVMIHSVHVKFDAIPSSLINPNQVVMAKLIWDLQANGTNPSGTDIISANANVAAFSSDWSAPPNLSNRDRFVTLWEKTMVLNGDSYWSGAAVQWTPQRKFFEKYKRVNRKTVYGGTTGAIGSIVTGALYLLLASELATVSQCPAVTSGTARIRFTDC